MARKVTIQEAKNTITQIATGVFSQYMSPQMHFTEMLGKQMTDHELSSWVTEDFKEKESVDVDKSTQGNSNIFSTFKQYITSVPDYKEYFDIEQLWTGILGANASSTLTNSQLNALLADTEKKTYLLMDKIHRAVERKSADLFNTGILSYKNAGVFDFKREASSTRDLGAASYWSNASASFRDLVLNDRDYFREVAQIGVTELKYTMSTLAWESVKKTTEFKEEISKGLIEYTEFTLSKTRPDMNTAHYEGSYRVNGVTCHIWTYDGKSQGAVNGTDDWTRYLDETKVVAVPTDSQVGAIVNFPLRTVVTDKYGERIEYREYPDGFAKYEILDKNAKSWRSHCDARKVPVLLYKNRVRTSKVLADA